jgi:hypothetical protein
VIGAGCQSHRIIVEMRVDQSADPAMRTWFNSSGSAKTEVPGRRLDVRFGANWQTFLGSIGMSQTCHLWTSKVLSAGSEAPRHRSKTRRPSPFLECRLDAPPADPRKGPISRALGAVGDVSAPGIRSDRID